MSASAANAVEAAAKRKATTRTGSANSVWRTALVLLLIAIAWEVVGRLQLVGHGAFPSLSAIAESWWTNRAIYPKHILSTFQSAGLGFAIGNVIAIVLAVVFLLLPPVDRLLRPLVVVLFCLPVVVVAPILGVAFHGDAPRVLLATLLVFFPTMIATSVGLSQAPGDAIGVVTASGGGSLRALALVRLRAALPDILSGLQIAAPAAFLGAILGEFLGGSAGLGVYLIGSMGRGDAATLWAIGLVATIASAAVYGLVGLVRRAVGANNTRPAVDLSSSRFEGDGTVSRSQKIVRRVLWGVGGWAVVVLGWFAFIASTGLPTTLMNSPIEVFNALFTSPIAAQTRATVLAAFTESVLPAIIGTASGLALAIVLAVALSSFPSVARAVMPFAFVSQTIPLVALAPLIALLLGRGEATIIAVTISVTFFPSLVTMIQGIANAPTGQLDVLRSVDASRLAALRLVILPNAVPYILASVRLAVPRALTGVLIAEQFITGTGLGGLLSISRGYLDYRMMWVITVLVALFSLIVYEIALAAERRVLARRS